jgi:hypothetical protein
MMAWALRQRAIAAVRELGGRLALCRKERTGTRKG